MKQSGGHIWVYSEHDRGTTFRVYLPRTSETLDGQPAPAEARVVESPRGGETILLVEDEAQLRTVAQGILRRAGFHVLTAANPREAMVHHGALDSDVPFLQKPITPDTLKRKVTEVLRG